MLLRIKILMIVSVLLLITACSSSPNITTPVSIPKIDRAHLLPCDPPKLSDDIDPMLWIKSLVDFGRECADGKQVLIDYINVIESEDNAATGS